MLVEEAKEKVCPILNKNCVIGECMFWHWYATSHEIAPQCLGFCCISGETFEDKITLMLQEDDQ